MDSDTQAALEVIGLGFVHAELVWVLRSISGARQRSDSQILE
jgi:hypothetical protein